MINISNQQRKYIITPTVPEGTQDISYSIYLDNQVIYNGRCRYLDSFEIDLADFVEQEWDKGNNEGNFVINISYSNSTGIGNNETTETITCPFEKETIALPTAPETGCDYMNLIISNSDFKTVTGGGTQMVNIWENSEWNIEGFTGSNIWKTNSGSIYYSDNTLQYKLVVESDGQNSTLRWEPWDWGKYIPKFGENVWHDTYGNTFYSYQNDQFQYDETTGNWKLMRWNGSFVPPSGRHCWNYIDDPIHTTFYSQGTTQYQLLYDSQYGHHWYANPFSGDLIPEDGGNIWQGNDGRYYYSYNDKQWVFTYNNRFISIRWSNFRPDVGSFVWHDNDGTIYYSFEGDQYKLENNIWVENHIGPINFPQYGDCVWTDFDGNYHFDYSLTHYKQSQVPIPIPPEITYDITIPLKVKSGILSGKTINNLDKITYTDRYGDRHNSAVSNKMEIECYVDDSWLKTFTGNDITYAKLMSAIQSARNSLLTGNATISGMDITGPVNLKCRVKDIETIETYSVYSANNKIPSYKITIEIYR